MADNPFTLTYDTLWTLVERNTALTDLVAPSNRIKFDDELGMKKVKSSADKPELILVETGGLFDLKASSTGTRVTKQYSWMVATDSSDINRLFNQLVWELLRGMVDWDKILCALQWENINFVLDAELTQADTGELLRPHTARIKGWASTINIRVLMSVPTSLLRIPDP